MGLPNHLAAQWRANGVAEGDVLLVHSSLRRLLRGYLKKGVKLTPQDVLASFLTAVGGRGTLLLPLFNFDFTKGVPFDIRSTTSQMGALTEAGRLHPEAVRTGHPIYSFVVIGAQSERFNKIENFSGYGADSPFAVLRELAGKIAVLDLPDQHSMTFYHHVEEMHEVPYRYHKDFVGPYTGRDGKTETRRFSLFVRDVEKAVLTHVNPMGELLWRQGLYSGDRPGVEHGLRVIQAEALYQATATVIREGRAQGLLYRIETAHEKNESRQV